MSANFENSQPKQIVPAVLPEQVAPEGVEYTDGGEPILLPAALDTWAKEAGYGSGKRGTFRNDESFLYIKTCLGIGNREDIDSSLAAARQLTSLGVIHPDSKWGVYKSPAGNGFQAFVISPKMEAWTLADDLEGAYDGRAQRPFRDQSHLDEWIQRVDPAYGSPERGDQKNPLLSLLNPHEASNPDNWGWDERGGFYPVDVEVINLGNMNAIKQWYAQQQSQDASPGV